MGIDRMCWGINKFLIKPVRRCIIPQWSLRFGFIKFLVLFLKVLSHLHGVLQNHRPLSGHRPPTHELFFNWPTSTQPNYRTPTNRPLYNRTPDNQRYTTEPQNTDPLINAQPNHRPQTSDPETTDLLTI